MSPAAAYNESCGNNVQIGWLSKFLRPCRSSFHFDNWMKTASGISSAGKCSSSQMQRSLLLVQSGFSKQSSFLV